MSQFRGLYDIRDSISSDQPLILATFLRGLYYGDSGWISLIPKQIFMPLYKPIIQGILDSPNTTIKVACLKDDPDVILGYSVLSSDFQTIHFTYVKKLWRKKGIGKSLVPAHPTYISHLTKVGKSLLHKFPNVTFNPFITL